MPSKFIVSVLDTSGTKHFYKPVGVYIATDEDDLDRQLAKENPPITKGTFKAEEQIVALKRALTKHSNLVSQYKEGVTDRGERFMISLQETIRKTFKYETASIGSGELHDIIMSM